MKKTYINKLATILTIPAIALSVFNCSEPDMPTPEPATTATTSSANIRFLNASPDAPALSFSVNNVASAQDISFTELSDYFKAPAGQASVRGVATTGEIGGTLGKNPILYRATATSQNNFTFNNNGNYTFIVTDTLLRSKPTTPNGTNPGGPQFLTLSDNLSAPAEGKAKIRIIHVAPGVATVFAEADGEDFGTFNVASDKRVGIAYRAATAFQSVTAGDVTLTLHTGEIDGPEVISTDLALESGKIYTVVLTGKVVKAADAIRVPLAITVYQYN